MVGKDYCINKILHEREFARAIQTKVESITQCDCEVDCLDMTIAIRIFKDSSMKTLYLQTDFDFKEYELVDVNDNKYGSFKNEELICWALDLSTTTVQFFICEALKEKEVA